MMNKKIKKPFFAFLIFLAGLLLVKNWGAFGLGSVKNHPFTHDLALEYIVEKEPKRCQNNGRITLYFHGWGETKHGAHRIKRKSGSLPGTVVTFNFADAGSIKNRLFQTNFGQIDDLLVAAWVLNHLKETHQLHAIDLYGYSRGGATVLNLLAVLHDAEGLYSQDLARIGIDDARRKELLVIIEKGSIVLDCPLSNVNDVLRYRYPLSYPVLQQLMQLVSRYKKDGLQALSSAELLGGCRLNILLHLQHNDSVVLNVNDCHLYKALWKANPATTYLVIGNDGGHYHNHRTLSPSVNAFKKLHGGSYYVDHLDRYHFFTHQSSSLDPRLYQPADAIESHYQNVIARFSRW